MSVQILPATSDRFDDAEHALTGGGEGPSCQCQWWMLTNADYQKTTLDERRELLRTELSAERAPALIAYVDGAAAGWVRVGPRDPQMRIARTREITGGTAEPFDDPDVWAVSCFVVRREHRGAGLTSQLLDAAVAHARAAGARVIEAYPIDATVSDKKHLYYRGLLSVFESAGFDVVARPKPDRAIVTLTLRNAESAARG
jgi:GNAT superfamily N-acetyltransferase